MCRMHFAKVVVFGRSRKMRIGSRKMRNGKMRMGKAPLELILHSCLDSEKWKMSFDRMGFEECWPNTQNGIMRMRKCKNEGAKHPQTWMLLDY